MKVVFFGTPQIAEFILKSLLDHKINVVAVVTKPDKKQGRNQKLFPPPVKQFLSSAYPKIPIFQPEKASSVEFEEVLKNFQADLFVVVAYGEILKQNILDIPKLDCINVHASLLPLYRGAAPIHRAIIDGQKESGVTIMKMVLKMDAGDIINSEKIPISKTMTTGELYEAIEEKGARALLKTIQDYKVGSVTKTPQDENLVTYAKKITTEESEVLWNRPSRQIYNLIRGVTPFPGAWCRVKVDGQEKRLKIKKCMLVDVSAEAGASVVYENGRWVVAAADGGLALLEVQLEGKKSMEVSEFQKGYSCPEFIN